jgi:transposase
MQPLRISDSETMVLALQDEIRRSEDARYDHRLHGVLLVAQGMTCREVAALMGDAARTVEYWVRNFETQGFAGLAEHERSGRPRRLSETQLEQVCKVLHEKPSDVGLESQGIWDGKSLSQYLKREFDVQLEARQCQRLFRQLGFRLRTPRPQIASPDPVKQAAYKKTAAMGEESKH